ncbi:hypothetical protein Salpa_1867 [Sporomusa sp. KB1]|jgi:hypothetical protein|nr:hypothetical protein Salpa_1867 [Sporomusa sp. KB1]
MEEKEVWHAPVLRQLSVADKTENDVGLGGDGGGSSSLS